MTAIIKVIFDHIKPLKPLGYVLADRMPHRINIKSILKKILK